VSAKSARLRPKARLVVGCERAWTIELSRIRPRSGQARVELIEQPLPAGKDAALAGVKHPVPVCADESCTTGRAWPASRAAMDAVNVKLDKTGGLTEALAFEDEARRAASPSGRCMVGTSRRHWRP